LEGLWPVNLVKPTGTARWSCDLHSAGLASAVARDGQQKHFVHPGAGERQPTEFVGSEALKMLSAMTHCIELIMRLSCSDYIFYLFLY